MKSFDYSDSQSNARWYLLNVNPEPWAIGTINVGKKNNKFFPRVGANPQLVAYKEAIADELANVEKLPDGQYDLDFFLWRTLDSYVTASGKRHRKHQSDATNLQKALEDALQGVLFDNDRDVRAISSTVVEQGADVTPRIVISVTTWDGFNPDFIPNSMWELIDHEAQPALPDSNDWFTSEDTF